MPRRALIIALTFAFSGCSQFSGGPAEVFYNAPYPAYASVSDLGEAADLIIEGTVISSEVKELEISMTTGGRSSNDTRLNPGGETQPTSMIYTVHGVRISDVIKGSAKTADNIEVKELGGLSKGTFYHTAEGIVLKNQGVYVMYLQTFEGSPATLLNPLQAAYPVENGKVSALPGNSLPPGEVPRRDR